MKNVYISWHYTTHGIVYLKHILSRLYMMKDIKNIDFKDLNQNELNGVFDKNIGNGFVFDKIIYLTAPQDTLDRLSGRRFKYRETILEENSIVSGLKNIYKKFLEINKRGEKNNNNPFNNIEEAIKIVNEKFSNQKDVFLSKIWKNIHHYPVEEQIKWLKKYSNFKNIYDLNRLEIKSVNIDDLKDEGEIAQKLKEELKNEFNEKYDNFIVNISLGSNETQVVWHILSEANILPKNTRFIKVFDDKNTEKIKTFGIKEIDANMVSSVIGKIKIYENTQSPKRELAKRKMETFMKNGSPIFLLGERGTGKTTMVKDIMVKDSKIIIKEANCASFADDTTAESELFGYEKGAFTGGLKNGKKGLFQEANGGILFFDEIHSLSEIVQEKLMKTLQPDNEGNFLVRPFGATKEEKVKCRVIFASNRSIEELKERLLPDFYDRIVQQVVDIPPLRDTREDIESDWENTWRKTAPKGDCPKDKKLINWLKTLKLNGNFRDLEKIAMYYYTFGEFSGETKKMIAEKDAFAYAKSEFNKYYSDRKQDCKPDMYFCVETDKTAGDLTREFHYKLQEWAVKKWGSREKASEILKTDVRTLNNWKNKK